MASRDPWAVLGVAPGASLEEARRAYLVRLQLVHPDRHQGMPAAVLAEAERETRELNAAWEAVEALASSDSRPSGPPPSPPPRPTSQARPPESPAACLQWAIDRLIAAGGLEGHPLTASEVELLRRPRAAAPRGRHFQRWVGRRRATLAIAVANDGADAWAAAVRVLTEEGPSVVLALLFSP